MHEDMDPDEFVGYILSIKTQPSAVDGISQAIIGTVRVVNPKQQTITLDDVIINGTNVDGGYTLSSAIIEDITVCGKAVDQSFRTRNNTSNSILEQQESAMTSTANKPLQDSKTDNSDIEQEITQATSQTTTSFEDQLHNLGLRPTNQIPTHSAGVQVIMEPAFVKVEKEPVDTPTRTNPFYALNPACGGIMGIGPPATKPTSTEISKMQNPPKISDSRVVYTASDCEKKYFEQVAKSPRSNILGSKVTGATRSKSKVSVPSLQKTLPTVTKKTLPPSQDQNRDPKDRITTFNTIPGGPVYKRVVQQQQPVQSALKTLPVRVQKYNLEKSPMRALVQSQAPLNTGFGKSPNKARGHSLQPQTAGPTIGRGPPPQRRTIPASSAFEMANVEIKSQEFDFEENLALFAKLSLARKSPEPLQMVKEPPQLAKANTSYNAERCGPSTQLEEKAAKVYVTDTGVVVSAVSLPLRSRILNRAHNCGLTHERMVETMGRAVAETVIAMLGNSNRLTSERGSVLVFVGPHWNGAVGVSAARVLSTQGIRTNVCIWDYELEFPLLATELQLYRLANQTVTTDMNELKGIDFDLVVGAMNDHRDTIISVDPFRNWAKGKPIVLVDPPLVTSYRKTFLKPTQVDTKNRHQNDSQIVIVAPMLPLAYPTESAVKLYLVNLGIPYGVFEESQVFYKSQFVDKLVFQLFPTKQEISPISTTHY